MPEVSVEKKFRGSVRLVTLHLWRVAKSTNLDECFAETRKLGMINEENEAFIRKCLDANERMENGEAPSISITQDTVAELQACALRLNSADPA